MVKPWKMHVRVVVSNSKTFVSGRQGEWSWSVGKLVQPALKFKGIELKEWHSFKSIQS